MNRVRTLGFVILRAVRLPLASNVPGRFSVLCSMLFLLSLSSCAERDHRIANIQGNSIRIEKQEEVERFRQEQLLDPEILDETLVVKTGDALQVLDLESAILLATKHNRDYQSQRESFFQSALSLGVTRRDFLRPVFSGSASFTASDGTSQDYQEVAALSLGGSQFLYTGGTLSLSASSSRSRVESDPAADPSASGSFSATITQPLLRGGGHEIAFESLTQAERNLLYTARQFELFRQNFAIQIVQKFFGLLSQEKQLVNTQENITGQQFAYDQAKALFRIGTGSSLDVFRAEQALLVAQNSGLNSEQQFLLDVDNFKIDLGISTDTEISLKGDFPEVSVFRLDPDLAVNAALNNRLDLLTTREQLQDAQRRLELARNGLLPSLGLTLAYSSSSDPQIDFGDLQLGDDEDYSVGVALELPFDRLNRRNSFRNAEISLDQAQRRLDQAEDEISIEVRSSLRTLEQLRFQIEIGEKTIESFSFTVEKAEIDQLRGLGTNRDVVEAKNSLTDAKNDQLDRIVSHEIQLLRLQNQLGLLFVDEKGTVSQ
ncbi:MAG: TolC family protein [Planctomycetota bacterium]